MSKIRIGLDHLSPEDKRDYQAEVVYKGDISLPEEYLVKPLLPVRAQGVQGSCVAMSSASIKEIQERKDVNFQDYFSPQFIYNLRVNQDIEGMYPRDAMHILHSVGCVPEEEYPYGKIETSGSLEKRIIEYAANFKIDGYAFVNTINTLKEAIYKNGGCVFCVPVYNNEKRMWRPETLGQVVQGYHAMAAVGWNKEGFILRNSWGDKWGDKGYTIFPYKDWGMQSEVWTFLDKKSEQPKDEYVKWYFKVLRAIKNIYINNGAKTFTYGIMIFTTLLMALINKDYKLGVLGVGMIGLASFYIYKTKSYLRK